MKRILLSITGLLFTLCLMAQETGQSVTALDDSLHMLLPVFSPQELTDPGSERVMPASIFSLPGLLAFDPHQFIQPEWKKYNPSRNIESFSTSSLFSPGFFFPPSGFSGAVLNQASYRLSPKFSIGGNSFGINSPLSAPLQRSLAGQWQSRGASMFFEYKFSKNFRIETRVSVTGNQLQP
jgi:hypothetical protein